MKTFLKEIGILFGVVILILSIGMMFLMYELNYKKVEISQSTEGDYTISMYQIGEPAWPFGPVHGKFVLRKDGRKLNTYSFLVSNDGGGLTSGNAIFKWTDNCVEIRVSGEEQEDMLYILGFDGSNHNEKAGECYDRTHTYNELYTQMDETLHTTKADADSNDTFIGEETKEISQEVLDYYMTLEPSCSFVANSGMEYRMVAVDRALGSNFYVLVGTEDGGETCAFVNPDPYNGSGGEARWIIFIDEKLGFSCLAHAAGVYGSFYRTEDGGNSWEEITYPSIKVMLSDGTYYNPFVMPEKVYEKEGILYMEAGQGANGDYYDEQGFCHGLYKSSDKGFTWEFVRNIPQ